MFPAKTILLAIDLSPALSWIFHFACILARTLGGRLVVFHVAEPPVVLYDHDGNFLPHPRDYRAAAHERLLRLRDSAPDLPIEICVTTGEVAAEIVRKVEALRPDMLVMGTHGRRGLDRCIIGSVAAIVMRRVQCPVAVVHPPAEAPSGLKAPKQAGDSPGGALAVSEETQSLPRMQVSRTPRATVCSDG